MSKEYGVKSWNMKTNMYTSGVLSVNSTMDLSIKISNAMNIPKNVVDKVLEVKKLHPKQNHEWLAKKISKELDYNLTGEVFTNILKKKKEIERGVKQRDSEIENSVKVSQSWKGIDIYSKWDRIKSLNDLLKATDVNMDEWDVKNYIVNKWDNVMRDTNDKPIITELFQVKATLEHKKVVMSPKDLEDIVKTFKMKLAPKFKKINYPKNKSGNILVVNVYDAHLNKLCWDKETGTAYDWDIAEKLYIETVMKLIHQAQRSNPEQIVFVIGNDLLNTDNSKAQTTAGTPQTNNLTRKESIKRLYHLHYRLILMLLEVCKVKLIFEPWNHDSDTIFQLGTAIEVFFANNPNLEIDNSPSSRKYIEHWVNLLWFAHWNNEADNKIALLMLTENKGILEGKTHIEMKRWHTHWKKKLISNVGNEINGIEINTVSSISWTDTRHNDKWYTGNKRQWEASIYNDKQGKIADIYARV